jgi:hypothetical protein
MANPAIANTVKVSNSQGEVGIVACRRASSFTHSQHHISAIAPSTVTRAVGICAVTVCGAGVSRVTAILQQVPSCWRAATAGGSVWTSAYAGCERAAGTVDALRAQAAAAVVASEVEELQISQVAQLCKQQQQNQVQLRSHTLLKLETLQPGTATKQPWLAADGDLQELLLPPASVTVCTIRNFSAAMHGWCRTCQLRADAAAAPAVFVWVESCITGKAAGKLLMALMLWLNLVI